MVSRGSGAAIPETVERRLIAGEQVAVAMGNACDRPGCVAVSGVALGLVGGILPEAPTLLRPGGGQLGLLPMVGQPQIATREEGTGRSGFLQPDGAAGRG